MDDKNRGFYKKYHVEKLSNPTKKLDCVVLEFDDPIDRQGIQAWAKAMDEAGYHKCAAEAFAKLLNIEHSDSVV